jgi:hypothetical protein
MRIPHLSFNRLLTSSAGCQRRRRGLYAGSIAAVGLALTASSPGMANALAAVSPGSPASEAPITRITTTVTDPDDTDGRFDIARVSHQVDQFSRRQVTMTYWVSTFASFASARLNARHRNFVLELNRDGEPGSERNVRISRSDGHLIAEVISNATREVIDTVDAWRPSNRSIVITGPREVLGARSYFWTSNFHTAGRSACGWGDGYPITCQDSVPQDGWIRLDRPAWPETP